MPVYFGLTTGGNPCWFVMLTPVLVLYGVYVLCTVALIWAAIAVTRHIVLHRRATRMRTEHHDDHV